MTNINKNTGKDLLIKFALSAPADLIESFYLLKLISSKSAIFSARHNKKNSGRHQNYSALLFATIFINICDIII